MDPNINHHDAYKLSKFFCWLLSIASFVLVAFGQPAWIPSFGLIASACGFALFWRVLLSEHSGVKRFWTGTFWFFGVQLVQLSWFISHPFLYIYSVYILAAFILGLQFGVLGFFIKPALLRNFVQPLGLSGLWTMLEWSRLFFLSGFSWNPIGLELTSSRHAMQLASLWGVFGLSFWVIFVNLLALKAWIAKTSRNQAFLYSLWIATAAFPYVYGALHIHFHEQKRLAFEQKQSNPPLSALLLQTAFPIEELMDSTIQKNKFAYVLSQWQEILRELKKYKDRPIDLIVFPEYVVPFGTYSFVFPVKSVLGSFADELGKESLKLLPSLQSPFSAVNKTQKGLELLANNAFWIQGIANYFKADVLIGLEDAEDISYDRREYYSGALLFHPLAKEMEDEFQVERYEKRVLVPMGEYIPFSFFKNLAASYGVFGAFTPGKEAKVMQCSGTPFSASICYEETFGDLMREGRKKGAKLFINMTSDIWFPNSRLINQHFDHARLRTVENGVPLLRACNTGITAALDSLGKPIAVLGGDHPEEVEWIRDSLLVDVPTYTYSTLYSKVGDQLIIGLSLLFILLSLVIKKSEF